MTSSPIINYPITNWVDGSEYKTDKLTQVIGGTIPVISSEVSSGAVYYSVQMRHKIKRGGSESAYSTYTDYGISVGSTITGVNYIPWYFNSYGIINSIEDDLITLQFKTIERRRVSNSAGYVITESSPITIIASIVKESELQETVSIPTGTKIERANEYIKILVPDSAIVLNNNANFVGVNFYLSLSAGGGIGGYQLMNEMYITSPDLSEEISNELVQSQLTNEAGDLGIKTTVTKQNTIRYYTFTFSTSVLATLVADGKIDNIFLSDGVSIDPNTRFYFTTTFVSYDELLSQVLETDYSIELEGSFLHYSTDYQGLPPRTRSDVLFSATRSIVSNNNKVNLISGSVIRDILDPITLEFEKFYVIQDFIFLALSVDTLLAFDDSDGDGLSDPLSENFNKRRLADALSINDEFTFQLFIDEQFDRLASNFNLTRTGAVNARGSVVFFTTTEPSNDILIPAGTVVTAPADANQGISSQNFRVVSTRIMDSDNIQYYYNAPLGRYEIEVDIEAQSTGSLGNVSAGAITEVAGLNPIIQVENSSPTDFGEDSESNSNLANRIKLAQISYDSGTEGGYASKSLKVPGVHQVRVEKVGDPLLHRDYDPVSKEHIGGKVDIWVKGERLLQTVDQVAFKYEYPSGKLGEKINEIFNVINASEFKIKSTNTKVSADNPIVSVKSVRNVTRGEEYNIENIQFAGNGDTIVLENNLSNVNIGMGTFDVISVDYRFRGSNILKLSNQPVRELVSITDSNDQIIDPSFYRLIKKEDILKNGYSTIASDGVEFLFIDNSQFEEVINVENEEHDLNINIPVNLSFKGIDLSTIVVKNVDDNSIIYIEDVDYSIEAGDEVEYTQIKLLSNSKIRKGSRVSIDYTAAQNFNVTYTYNNILQEVQEIIDSSKHAEADVIVKEAIENFIDLSFKVIAKIGTNKKVLKSRVQTAVANFVSRLKTGDTFTQGSLVNTIKSVNGVKEIQLPLIKMMKRTNSYIPYEDIGNVSFQVYQRTSSKGITSYITLENVLSYSAQEKGGPDNYFKGVYENDVLLTLVEDPSEVALKKGSAYIHSDGKLIVSTLDGDSPQRKSYKVTYFIEYPEGTKVVEDLKTGQIEYLSVDSLSLRDIEILDEQIVKRGL